MQKTFQSKIVSTCIKLLVVIGIAGASPVHSAFLYKSYIVRQDRGYDILCDPYVVKKNDYVLKLFRQKGEIAHTDFPEFLSVFKRINPHIRDINRIRPNQQIFIPLKRLKPGALPGQSSGIVTIPFVTISNQVERISAFSTPYQVQSGDCVSILIARRYGPYGSRSYREGLKLFKLANPGVTDIHRIYRGQRIVLPNPDIKRQPWFPSVLNGPEAATESPLEPDLPGLPMAAAAVGVSAGIESPPPRESALADVAGALGAELKDRGRYYFPGSTTEDVELDLSEFPVMAFNGQTFIFETGGRSLDPPRRHAVEAYWKNARILSIRQETSSEQILESVLEAGATEKTTVSEIAFQDNEVAVIVRAQWITPAKSGSGGTKNRTCITMIEDPAQKKRRMPFECIWHNTVLSSKS